MVIDKLYYERHPFSNAASSSFSFDEERLKDAIRRIYEKKFNPLTEIDEGIFNETWKLFNKATDEGFGKRNESDPDYDFYQQIRHNNAVFSAFRTHRLQNDMAAQLLDDKGKLKPFERFSADVEPITGKYNQQWLRTEYDTAIIRAHQAEDWLKFGEVKDMLPNLRWMPTTSLTPDAVHQQYWSIELTLPQEHPFWKSHRPGDRWNCKCTLDATDDEATNAEMIPDGGEAPDKGLDNNPGEDAKLFSDTHPYMENAYPDAKKAVGKFLSENIPVPESENFKLQKQYKNGGEVLVHQEVNRKGSDYKQLVTIANLFAKQGKPVKLTPSVHFKSEAYSQIYGSLTDTPYYRKCPDLKIGDYFYEFESYVPPFKKIKVSHMLTNGFKQASRIIINNTKGGSDRYIKRLIYERINKGIPVDEVWLYEKGSVRMLYKKQ